MCVCGDIFLIEKDFSREIPCLKTCVTWYLHWTWVNQEDRFRLFPWHLNFILHKKRIFWLFNGFDVDIIKFSLLENLFIQIFVAFEFQLNKKPFFIGFPVFSGTDFVFTEISSLENLFVHVFIVFEFQFFKKPIFIGLPVFCRSWFYHHVNQRTQFAFPAGFGRVLIRKSMKNRFFSDFRFLVGLDFITI